MHNSDNDGKRYPFAIALPYAEQTLADLIRSEQLVGTGGLKRVREGE